jgi:shikimate dehydrogenase
MPTVNERTLAVLGSPIGHSRSPVLHAAAYRVLGLPWRYESADVTSDGLAAFLSTRTDEWRGLSLTMPLKQAVLPLTASLDRIAELTGAANTILFDDGGQSRVVRGFNTDVAGIVRALHAAGLDRARTVHLIGAGATAASALVAAAKLGAEHVVVWARSPERASALEPLGLGLGLTIEIRPAAGAICDDAGELVVSTLPGGADAGLFFTQGARARSLLLDVAYDPWPSDLARLWHGAGGTVLSGLAMLVHQALLQVRVFVAGDPLQPLQDERAVEAAMLAAVGLNAAGQSVGGDRTASRPVPES